VNARPQVLLVGKVPAITQLGRDDLERLERAGIAGPGSLSEREALHLHSLDQVRADLTDCQLRERRVDELRADDLAGIDLVVTVGGDGTVLAVANLVTTTPLLAVNSDPARSVGHYTRWRADSAGAGYQAWRNGSHAIEAIPRLTACVGEQPACHHILNDCLFTNENPGAITRYVLRCGGREELHHSSGVWVATGAGSTAAIHSAGMQPCSPHEPVLLFKVREPYHGRGRLHLLEGRCLPPAQLELVAAIPGIRLYIDGSHSYLPVPTGMSARFALSPSCLQLVIAGG
jgi:NAD+ kinase